MIRSGLLGLIMAMFAAVAVQAQIIRSVNNIMGSAIALHLDGPTLYVGGSDQVRIYDLADGANPRLLNSFSVKGSVAGLASVGDILVVGTDVRGAENIFVVDLAAQGGPKVLFERIAGGGTLNDVHVVGRAIFVAVDSDLLTLQLNDVNEPVLVGQIALESDIREVIHVGSRAYVATDFSVDVLDISDPANVRLIHRESTLDFNNGLSIEDNILAVAEGVEGLTLYNLSNPDIPAKITTLPVPRQNEIFGVYLRQKFVYEALLFQSGFDVTSPNFPGGLRVIDIENVNNPRKILEQIEETPEDRNLSALDVVAYNGYVYLAEDFKVAIFRHGPLGEATRPTSTPIVPTNTPTPTNTLTPTNTPPFLTTATPRPMPPTNTPLPVASTNTPRPLPTNTPAVVVPTNTPAQVQPTATATNTRVPSTGGLTPLFSSTFDGPFLSDTGFADQLPFSGSFARGEMAISAIPVDNAFAGATNGQGLIVRVAPGQALTFLGPVDPLGGNDPVLLRVNVRSTGPGAGVALAGIDVGDNTVALTNPTNSGIFASGYKRFSLVFKAPTNNVLPLIQVAHSGQGDAVTVYFDNLDVIPLRPGTLIPVEELGVGPTAP